MVRNFLVVVLLLTAGMVLLNGCGGTPVDPKHTLAITVTGDGEVAPDGGTFAAGTLVDLEVIPESGWVFSRWEGKNAGEVVDVDNYNFRIKMAGDKELTAVFEEIDDPVTLTVGIEGEGGVIPAGGIFARGTNVSLTVIPDSGWGFEGWEGQDAVDVVTVDEEEGEYSILMDEDKEIVAEFVPIPITVPGDFTTIQGAINAAECGDVIIVKPGTYRENIDFKGKNITVRSTDPEDPDVVEATIIDGNSSGRVVTFNSGEGEEALLWGFTITGGDAGSNNGGGILVSSSSSPVIKGNVITDNTAYNGGGAAVTNQSSPVFEGNSFFANETSYWVAGIYVHNQSSVTIRENTFKDHEGEAIRIGGISSGDDATADITGNKIKNNTPKGYGTGGITVIYSSEAEIINNEIKNNTGKGNYDGAAVTISYNSTAEVKGNIITGNTGDGRGAIVVSQSEATIKDNTITGNSAEDPDDWGRADGGGIAIVYSSVAEISGNNIISDNTAEYSGGGMVIDDSEATIDSNEISNNSTNLHGGGVHILGGDAEVVITNNHISHNNAAGDPQACGGGISIWYGETTIYGNTIKDNYAGWYGGGIYIAFDHIAIFGTGEEPWPRENCPPGSETHNTYSDNDHGDQTIRHGLDVFFRETI